MQDDIKKVLAYSTISQLAYMVAALGMGEAGYPAAMFHLFTHAFFKALLFLGAGSVIHAAHSNNMSDMGGLRKHMKVTYVTFMIGVAGAGRRAAARRVLLQGRDHPGGQGVPAPTGSGIVLLAGAVLTAFYTTRMVLKTFFGEYRGTEHLHESPRSMTAPLVLLADATCFVGLLGFAPAGAPFLDWVYFGDRAARGRSSDPAGGGRCRSLVVAIGLFFGYRTYKRRTRRSTRSRSSAGCTTCSSTSTTWTTSTATASCARSATRGRPASTGSTSMSSTPWSTARAAPPSGLSGGIMWIDRTIIDGIVNGAGTAAQTFGKGLRTIQTGKVQWYAVGLFAGVIALAVFFIR